jgi:DNA modification methylase
MEAMQTVLGGKTADMVFTDPPNHVANEGKTTDQDKIPNDEQGDKLYEFLRQVSTNLIAACHGAIYTCICSSALHTLHRAFTDAGGHWSAFVIWSKHHFTLGPSDYQPQYEPILYGWPKDADRHWYGARDQGDMWFIPRPTPNREHPTLKPVELVEQAVTNSSKIGDIVLDTFAGSGTTLIACERLRRRAHLIEIDPRYADVICHRWHQFSGQEAVLDGDGRTFAEIAMERQQKAA